jgi:CubicO group peptidase (beta-lactamase class C family)
MVPGVCTGSLDGGEESYGSYGVRSVEDPVPVNEDTLFRVASISKLITATLLVRLGIGLDAAVRDHLPDFQLADPTVAERVTVRDLLTHRAGFAPDHAMARPADELDDGALARAVTGMATAPQIFPLRRFYGYSNAGFVILARIAEVVAGEPYEHAARRLVFEPAGMERSTFFTDEAITYPIALGHDGTPPRVVRPWGRSRATCGSSARTRGAASTTSLSASSAMAERSPGSA